MQQKLKTVQANQKRSHGAALQIVEKQAFSRG